MLMRKCLMFASLSAMSCPRRCYAASQVIKAATTESYRQRFERLNESDNKLVIEKYKKELTKAFGHSQVISTLSDETINELHYVLKMYYKPLSPEMRIILRKKLLPYLESKDKETQKLFEYILKYYEVL